MVPFKSTAKRFYLNGHTIGFPSQTQKLELHYMFSAVDSGSKSVGSWPPIGLQNLAASKRQSCQNYEILLILFPCYIAKYTT